ncbi:MAG: hypothetical protein IPJ88_13150 [Myxococcales bacterium]|nr:MAG: hypothetical protein IPJ88_13150 [Myxococcales bacterium]
MRLPLNSPTFQHWLATVFYRLILVQSTALLTMVFACGGDIGSGAAHNDAGIDGALDIPIPDYDYFV